MMSTTGHLDFHNASTETNDATARNEKELATLQHIPTMRALVLKMTINRIETKQAKTRIQCFELSASVPIRQ